ncbi:MAG: alkene reductase [Propionibacteriaceae bacterium]|nr:alkene reductase [Propionibacteriaceae bacterium]
MTTIWNPVHVGTMSLPNRLAMAPMTRSRAKPDGDPGDLAALYYSQRASMGLIISEGTQPSDDGQGYILSPGIYRPSHVAGWRTVTDAVHAAGGRIVIQLMHAGRMSHPDNTPHHRPGMAPSAIAPGVPIFTATGMQDIPVPHALTESEIAATVDDFRHAAACAIEAGADGVEVHGANGYLLHQFIAEGSNVRTDTYGGSPQNRARMTIETVSAVAAEIGPQRTGLRISPGNLGNVGIDEGEHGKDVYRAILGALAGTGMAYLHVVHSGDDAFLEEIRRAWPGALLVNRPGRPLDKIDADIKAGLADVAAVGAWALANPDLVERLKLGADLNQPDHTTFFGGGAHGYTDYPTLDGLTT